MHNLHIYPGALKSEEDGELLYRCLRSHQPILPQAADLGEIPLIIRHQHKLPVCTGEAGAYLRAVLQYQKYGQILDFSGMFIYKMNRLYYDGLKPQTRGSTLKATMQTLCGRGVCLEESYRTDYRTLREPFPKKKYGAYLRREAANYRLPGFARIIDLDDMLLALADERPVIFSLIIYTDFYEAKEGIVAPKISGRKIGGHSMVALGYDMECELVKVVQSWGKDKWGPTDEGYMYIPFERFRGALSSGTPHLIEAYCAI